AFACRTIDGARAPIPGFATTRLFADFVESRCRTVRVNHSFVELTAATSDPASAEGMADVRESWRLLRRAVEEYQTAERLDPYDLTTVHDLAFLHAEGGDEVAFRQKLEEFIKRARNETALAEVGRRSD